MSFHRVSCMKQNGWYCASLDTRQARIQRYFTAELAKWPDWWPRTVAEDGVCPLLQTGYQEEQSIRWGITLKPNDKVICCRFQRF